MGHANIYIRKDNETKWDNIPDKSAWINDMVSKSGAKEIYFDRVEPKPIVETELKKIINTVNHKSPKANLCKHGNPKGQCMDKQASRMKCNV